MSSSSPAARPAPAQSTSRLGLGLLVALVVGSIIGSGIFGLLEWLGLPASRQTLTILRHLESADLPQRFLEPLRTQLWEPRTIFALQRIPAITDRDLAVHCHAAAA